MREACGPLLTFILQPLEYPSSAASPLIQLFVDLLKHLLHLPGRCLVELLWDKKKQKETETEEGELVILLFSYTASMIESCCFSVCSSVVGNTSPHSFFYIFNVHDNYPLWPFGMCVWGMCLWSSWTVHVL